MADVIAPPVLVSRRVRASPEQVFRAWTEPELLKKWWGPASFSVPSVELDLRVGGQFVFAMKPPDRPAHLLFGTYVEIQPPKRLVFTWMWGDAVPGPKFDSLVTVEMRPVGAETEVTVTHEKLPQPVATMHVEGWTSTMDSLQSFVAETFR